MKITFNYACISLWVHKYEAHYPWQNEFAPNVQNQVINKYNFHIFSFRLCISVQFLFLLSHFTLHFLSEPKMSTAERMKWREKKTQGEEKEIDFSITWMPEIGLFSSLKLHFEGKKNSSWQITAFANSGLKLIPF